MATAEATMNTAEIVELFKRYVVPNYRRYPVALVRGEGSYVWDAAGQSLSRFLSRLGLQLAGPLSRAGRRGRAGAGRHADPRAQHLVHRGPGPLGQAALASAALAARRSSATRAPRPTKRRSSWPGCTRPRAATRSSRSTAAFTAARSGATAATAQPKYHEGLGPLMAGFVYAPFGDLDAVAEADRRRDGRHPDRADPGRRGHQHSARRLSCRACASWPTSTSCC